MKIDGIVVAPQTARVFRALGGGFAVKVCEAGAADTLPGSDPELVFGPWKERRIAEDVVTWILDDDNEQEDVRGGEIPSLAAA